MAHNGHAPKYYNLVKVYIHIYIHSSLVIEKTGTKDNIEICGCFIHLFLFRSLLNYFCNSKSIYSQHLYRR